VNLYEVHLRLLAPKEGDPVGGQRVVVATGIYSEIVEALYLSEGTNLGEPEEAITIAECVTGWRFRQATAEARRLPHDGEQWPLWVERTWRSDPKGIWEVWTKLREPGDWRGFTAYQSNLATGYYEHPRYHGGEQAQVIAHRAARSVASNHRDAVVLFEGKLVAQYTHKP